MPRPTKMKPRIQIGVRCTAAEAEAAKALGNGNISQGFRIALRYTSDRNIKPMSLYLTLRAMCVELTDDLEEWVDGYLINDPADEHTSASFERIDRARALLAQPVAALPNEN